jgi:hypothetical protein
VKALAKKTAHRSSVDWRRDGDKRGPTTLLTAEMTLQFSEDGPAASRRNLRRGLGFSRVTKPSQSFFPLSPSEFLCL